MTIMYILSLYKLLGDCISETDYFNHVSEYLNIITKMKTEDIRWNQ